ncbi:MAG: hypothetical protein HDR00_02695 [Lachnospiraceae bacterium]|nr:hypothetical protein [Lachnospiraceae bacterium]
MRQLAYWLLFFGQVAEKNPCHLSKKQKPISQLPHTPRNEFHVKNNALQSLVDGLNAAAGGNATIILGKILLLKSGRI